MKNPREIITEYLMKGSLSPDEIYALLSCIALAIKCIKFSEEYNIPNAFEINYGKQAVEGLRSLNNRLLKDLLNELAEELEGKVPNE